MRDLTKLYVLIFWLSMLSIIAWVILKVMGIINTPKIVELYPILSAVFGAGAFFQLIFNMNKRLGKVENDLSLMKKDLHSLDKRLLLVEYALK